MVLKDIMSISGESGLFRFIAQGKNSIIVEHLETKKRSSAFGTARVSSLDEISVFTEKEDMPLSGVFDAIFDKENGGPAPDYKSDPAKLRDYLGEVVPEYDRDRVYVSDIKKIMHWYNILHSLNLLVREEPEKKEDPEMKEGTERSSSPSSEKTEKAQKKVKEKKASGIQPPTVEKKKKSAVRKSGDKPEK
jgi:hypothetical protein